MTAGDTARRIVAVGGSSSSGTTLLATILDRHPRLCCAGELSCLDRAVLYREPWPRHRLRLALNPRRRLEIEDVRWTRPLFDELDSTGIGRGELRRMVVRSTSFAGLIERFGARCRELAGKERWVEKTPTNIFCASEFLELFPEGRFVQVVRDGRDALVSQLRRGRSLQLSSWIWLCAVSAGYGLRDHPRVHTLRYEDLTADPERELHRLFDFLGERFEPGVLPNGESAPARGEVHGSWRSTPDQPISARSVGRYRRLLDRRTESLFFSYRLTKAGRRRYGVPFASVPGALERWGYDPARTDWPERSLDYVLTPPAPSARRRLEHWIRGKRVAEHMPQPFVRRTGGFGSDRAGTRSSKNRGEHPCEESTASE